MDSYIVSLLFRHVSKYFSIWESAKLLGGKRLDKQRIDELGWWVKSIAMEFEVKASDYERFESVLNEIYKGEIIITINRCERAALPV